MRTHNPIRRSALARARSHKGGGFNRKTFRPCDYDSANLEAKQRMKDLYRAGVRCEFTPELQRTLARFVATEDEVRREVRA